MSVPPQSGRIPTSHYCPEVGFWEVSRRRWALTTSGNQTIGSEYVDDFVAAERPKAQQRSTGLNRSEATALIVSI